MPRISTDNYDTVASWNGSQDLFVVEQPDGTKVATPAMVKQFIETGDFEATGEVKDGHGNSLKNIVDSLALVPFNLTISSTLTNVTRLNQKNYYIPATGEVRIQILIYTPDGNIPVNNNTIATIPAAYRSRNVETMMVGFLGNTSNNPAQMEAGYIDENGNIKFNNFVYGNSPAKWVYFNFSYYI